MRVGAETPAAAAGDCVAPVRSGPGAACAAGVPG